MFGVGLAENPTYVGGEEEELHNYPEEEEESSDYSEEEEEESSNYPKEEEEEAKEEVKPRELERNLEEEDAYPAYPELYEEEEDEEEEEEEEEEELQGRSKEEEEVAEGVVDVFQYQVRNTVQWNLNFLSLKKRKFVQKLQNHHWVDILRP